MNKLLSFKGLKIYNGIDIDNKQTGNFSSPNFKPVLEQIERKFENVLLYSKNVILELLNSQS